MDADGAAYTDAPLAHDGDTQCIACGGIMDPVQTLFSRTGRHWACDQAAAAVLKSNRMVAP